MLICVYIRWDDGTSNGVRLLRIDSTNEHVYLKGGSLGSSFHNTGSYRIYEIQGSLLVMFNKITELSKTPQLLKVHLYWREFFAKVKILFDMCVYSI